MKKFELSKSIIFMAYVIMNSTIYTIVIIY